jgi:hypothetical protein
MEILSIVNWKNAISTNCKIMGVLDLSLSEASLWTILRQLEVFNSNKSPYTKAVQQLFQGFEPMIANSSDLIDVT